jgi:hypothetical protein
MIPILRRRYVSDIGHCRHSLPHPEVRAKRASKDALHHRHTCFRIWPLSKNSPLRGWECGAQRPCLPSFKFRGAAFAPRQRSCPAQSPPHSRGQPPLRPGLRGSSPSSATAAPPARTPTLPPDTRCAPGIPLEADLRGQVYGRCFGVWIDRVRKNAWCEGKQRVGWKVDGSLRSACTGFSFSSSAPPWPSPRFRHGFPTLSTRYRSLTRSRMTSLSLPSEQIANVGDGSSLLFTASAKRQRLRLATSLKAIRHSRPRERGTSGECRETMPEH